MNYTVFALIGLGFLGMVLHCLVELNKLNKASNGNYKMVLKEYFRLEVFSLLISFLVVIGCAAISHEIELLLTKLGYGWLMGAAFICVGYSAQSILIFLMGKANKKIGNTNTD